MSKQIIKEYTAYSVEELKEVSERGYNKALEYWQEYRSSIDFMNDEYRATLEAFEDTFAIKVKDCNVDSCNYDYRLELNSRPYCEQESYSFNKIYRMLNDDIMGSNKPYYSKDYKKSRKSKIQFISECPLTGVFCDEDILEPIRKFLKNPTKKTDYESIMRDCLSNFFYNWSKNIDNEQSEERFIEDCKEREVFFSSNGTILEED